jgi:hypothetical protein
MIKLSSSPEPKTGPVNVVVDSAALLFGAQRGGKGNKEKSDGGSRKEPGRDPIITRDECR